MEFIEETTWFFIFDCESRIGNESFRCIFDALRSADDMPSHLLRVYKMWNEEKCIYYLLTLYRFPVCIDFIDGHRRDKTNVHINAKIIYIFCWWIDWLLWPATMANRDDIPRCESHQVCLDWSMLTFYSKIYTCVIWIIDICEESVSGMSFLQCKSLIYSHSFNLIVVHMFVCAIQCVFIIFYLSLN